MSKEIAQLFDRVLRLEVDEKIVLKFRSEGDLKSKKTMLFREKKAYENAMKDKYNFKVFFIRQKIDRHIGKFELELSTNGTSMDWFDSAVIIKKGGAETPLDVVVEDKNAARIEKVKNMQ